MRRRRQLGGGVVGAALLIALLIPCLCPLPAVLAASAHACCPPSETGLRAVDPSCCACLEARPPAAAAPERAVAAGPLPAFRGFVAPAPMTLTRLSAPATLVAISPSPPPSILRI